MKKILTPALLLSFACSLLAGGSPGGPFANGAYYPGYLNGKYMGVVTGNNISGVLGFAIVDGAPPFRSVQQEETTSTGLSTAVAVQTDFTLDFAQNYFAIFVEGRTYTGLTAAGIDIDSKTVSGALQGTAPAANLQFIIDPTAGFNPAGDLSAANALPIINRGLSGGFTAKITSDKAVFTFKGDGQLSTPANKQSYQIEALNATVGTQTNAIVTGVLSTESTPFQVKGIRTSFNSTSPLATEDALAAQTGASGGGN
jgi:hypothetical protein